MRATIISDKEFRTILYQNLENSTLNFLKGRGFDTEIIEIGREALNFCMGCFDCWVKKPGECIVNDLVSHINRRFIGSDAVIYLSPVVFGQFSANMKNAIDRWLPNMLPFFQQRPDGSTMHPSRYSYVPKLVIIGYGEDISDEDRQLFIDITEKHRRNVDVLIFDNPLNDVSKELSKIRLEKLEGKL